MSFAPNTPGAPLPPARQKALLEQHNAQRRRFGVADLTWSDNIAVGATSYAAALASQGCGLVHSPSANAAGLGAKISQTSPDLEQALRRQRLDR